MDYKVRTLDGTIVAGTSSTAVVIWYPSVAFQVSETVRHVVASVATKSTTPPTGNWTQASRNGELFSFKSGAGISASRSLFVETLAQTTLRVPVLIDAGSNDWRVGIVVQVGSDSLVGEFKVDSAARATRPARIDGYVFGVGITYRLVGGINDHGTPTDSSDDTFDPTTAEDGSTWFTPETTGNPVLRCGALSTVGALGSGKMLVETSPQSGVFVTVEL